jgi:hypothetical protein
MKKAFSSIIEKLNSLTRVKKVYIRNRSRLLDNLMFEKIRDLFFSKQIFEKNNIVIENSTFFLFGWNQYHLYRTNVPFFKLASNVILVEEGATAYHYPRPSKYSILIKSLYGMRPNFVEDDKVKSILVQFPDKYLENIRKKAERLQLTKMIEQLSRDEKQAILNIFLKNETKKQIECQFDDEKKRIIILTQPLSEDGYISEKHKKEVYKKIIDQYSKDFQIIIKKHPRERTSYQFRNVIELEGHFPSEVFKIIGIRFTKAIGICTSAINVIDADEKFNLDENFLSTRKKVMIKPFFKIGVGKYRSITKGFSYCRDRNKS